MIYAKKTNPMEKYKKKRKQTRKVNTRTNS